MHSWCLFVRLVQAAWTHGMIPHQLLWIIVVLIPKGGGDYCGIRLLEPIWKCIERVIDHQLDAIEGMVHANVGQIVTPITLP